MIAFSRNKQLVIYALLAVFVVGFFIYVYKQASLTEVSQTKVKSQGAGNKKIIGDVKINADFFESDKFRNLRFDSLPAVSFPVGKRDPFEPY